MVENYSIESVLTFIPWFVVKLKPRVKDENNVDGYGHKYFIMKIIVLAPVIARRKYGLLLVGICQLSKHLRKEAHVGTIQI